MLRKCPVKSMLKPALLNVNIFGRRSVHNSITSISSSKRTPNSLKSGGAGQPSGRIDRAPFADVINSTTRNEWTKNHSPKGTDPSANNQ